MNNKEKTEKTERPAGSISSKKQDNQSESAEIACKMVCTTEPIAVNEQGAFSNSAKLNEFASVFLQHIVRPAGELSKTEKWSLFKLLKAMLEKMSARSSKVDVLKMNSEKLVFSVGNYFCQVNMKREGGGDEMGSQYQFIIADRGVKKMAVLVADSMEDELIEMNMNGWKENGCIDLNSTGRHWEGEELNGKCFGYGKEYNEENNVEYEGFKFGNNRVCYGCEYRGIRDINGKNKLLYEGGYWNGIRQGLGISYDLNGHVEYEGEWKDNCPVDRIEKMIILKNENKAILPMLVEEVVIETNMFNDKAITTLHFSRLFIELKRIEIKDNCLSNVRNFILDGLERLETVKVGEKCCAISNKREDCLCQITNCPKLKYLEIGMGSFVDFNEFELSNVDSLQSIIFDCVCLGNVEKFVLKGK